MITNDDQISAVSRLKEIIKDRDSDIEKAAMFGKQLLEDKEILSQKIEELLSENESLKQDKYSLSIDLETQVKTVNTQSSELSLQREDYDNLVIKFQALQKENIRQKQAITNLMNEKYDSQKSVEDLNNENRLLKEKIVLQEQSLQNKAELTINISNVDDVKDEEFDANFYKMKNMQLQEVISNLHYELENSKMEESRLSSLVSKLEEDIVERDKELKSFSVEVQKARNIESELQGEIELLKLQQIDVNRRGNSMFGELDDRRKLVEKEYKLLANRYESLLQNFSDNRRELSKCKGQISILLSMTSRQYQDAYITRLENQLGDTRRELEAVTAKLNQCLKSQQAKIEPVAFKNDDYDYLRVMLQKAEEKVKSLENDLMTVRLQNISANDSLTRAQRSLYATQEDLNSMKLENLNLKQQIKELSTNPDVREEVPVKREPKVEYLPWYRPENSENNEKAQMSNKTNIGESTESVTPKSQGSEMESEEKSSASHKVALKECNSSAESVPKIPEGNDVHKLPPYGRKYKLDANRKKKDDDCRQQ